MIEVGDIYLDCSGVRRRCVEADGDEIRGVTLDDTAAALWCSHEHCRPRRVDRALDVLDGHGTLAMPPAPWRCTFPQCEYPDVCEGTHAVPAPRALRAKRRRWMPTRKWKGRR